jgi:hypothetical protein
MDTTNPPSAQSSVPEWRNIYVAALFETDEQKLPSRISALRALRKCLKLKTNKPDAV